MAQNTYNLAIETSSRVGSISVGRGDQLLRTVDLGPQKRHAVGLMPAIESTLADLGAGPANLASIFVSIGPGSFTGLRVGITTAKVLGRTLSCDLFPVPTLSVVAANVPADRPNLAVCLNAKRGAFYTGLFERDGETWAAVNEPELLEAEAILQRAGRPLAVIGDQTQDIEWPDDITILPSELAIPNSRHAWAIGNRLAETTEPIDPYALEPLYVRLPEPEELWLAKHGHA